MRASGPEANWRVEMVEHFLRAAGIAVGDDRAPGIYRGCACVARARPAPPVPRSRMRSSPGLLAEGVLERARPADAVGVVADERAAFR